MLVQSTDHSKPRTDHSKRSLFRIQIVLLQFGQESQLELVADKQVLLCGFVQLILVLLHQLYLMVIVMLSQIPQGIYQPEIDMHAISVT